MNLAVRHLRSIFGACLLLGLTLTAGAVPAWASSGATKAGTLQVISENGDPLNSGGSATPFSIAAPSRAACPGDTAHKAFLVHSFGVRQGTPIASLTFPDGTPSTGIDLVTPDGVPFSAENTLPVSGQLPDFPLFNWTRFDHQPAYLSPGVYDVGVACASEYGPALTYWDAEIRFLASSSDPGGFTWEVIANPASASGGLGGAAIGGVVAAVVVVAGIGAIMVLRRQRRQSQSTVPGGKPARISG